MQYKWMGLEVLERLRFLASLPLAGTAQTEGGGMRRVLLSQQGIDDALW